MNNSKFKISFWKTNKALPMHEIQNTPKYLRYVNDFNNKDVGYFYIDSLSKQLIIDYGIELYIFYKRFLENEDFNMLKLEYFDNFNLSIVIKRQNNNSSVSSVSSVSNDSDDNDENGNDSSQKAVCNSENDENDEDDEGACKHVEDACKHACKHVEAACKHVEDACKHDSKTAKEPVKLVYLLNHSFKKYTKNNILNFDYVPQ